MRWGAWFLSVFLSCSGAAAQAELRALLVGVSDYDDSLGLADLRGPANDITLLHQVLRARGASDITLLADGVPGGSVPSRAAILAAFGDLAARATAGDLVYIDLSGHGTRQGDPEGDETDGLDEVFLPADTGRAEPGSNRIPNALIDDEIGAAVRRIRQTGADVWLVMDSCHSGSGLRAAAPETAARFVDPALLGIDVAASRLGEAQVIEDSGPEPPGRFLAFYAAQSSELAREVNFRGEDGADNWFGLFSAKLAARMQDAGAISYRQLFQAVLADMNDGTVPGGARLQTPLWEGTLIDAAVFGGGDTAGLRRFALRHGTLLAGKVHGLSDGTVMGLIADAADPADAVLGFAQLQKTGATSARLIPVDAGCEPLATAPCAAAGSLPPNARFAQVAARPIDLVVRLAPPVDLASAAPLAADDPARVALDTALGQVNDGRGTRIEIDPAQYDIEVVRAEGALWFGPRAVIGNRPVGLPVAPRAPELAAALDRIRRAEDLARLLASVARKPSLLSPNPVEVTVETDGVDAALLEPEGSAVPPYEECGAAIGADASAPVRLPPGAELKQCDQLAIAARGTVSGARDVNRIHIDARFCVHAAHERIEGTAAPRAVGDGMIMCSDCPDGYSAGAERMFLVVTEAEDNTEPLNLEGLVETCAAPGATRGGAAAQLMSFLTAAAQRPGTRGSFGAMGATQVWVERFDWSVLPKSEAFARAGLETTR